MPYLVAVDIGGTFTDAVAVGADGGLSVGKAFSTPPDFSAGVVEAVRVVAAERGLELSELLADTPLFLHGTSIAENAIVDGTLATAGLLTTRGFEHTLAMTRGGYGRWSGLTEDAKKDVLAGSKPPTLIPFGLIEPMLERTDRDGNVLAEVDADAAAAALERLVELGAQAVGVCFLWSFTNQANEQRVREVAERVCPDVFLTLSSELAPVEGEYERTSTVALNARLGPIVVRYLQRLQERLQEQRFDGAIFLMQAHGGLVALADASARAVGLIESGPVAGLVASQEIGRLLGIPRVIAADMGGTTFKAGIVRTGRIEYEREPNALRYHYSLQKMRVTSIGLAGGSVISVDAATGIPKVGPRSAGSSPGPVCYGFGGTEPTVTDVDLLLGYLDSRFFLGGRATLDADTAERAFREQIAEPLGLDVMTAAGAVQRLANSMMYDLLHKETVEQGLDPSEYALFSYGGTAGMHMTSIGPELGVSQIVVPAAASVLGAFGLANADVVYAETTTRIVQLPADPSVVNELFDLLEQRVAERLRARAELATGAYELQRAVDVRYQRQVHTITTPVEQSWPLDERGLEAIGARFEELYAERYGPEAGFREAGLELVGFRARAVVRLDRPEFRAERTEERDPAGAYVETREAYFAPAEEMLEARCYDLELLRSGNAVEGPAIIWSPITTVVVNPGQTAQCDEFRNLVVTWPRSVKPVTETAVAAAGRGDAR
jgi:N-methylhydantoinase A